MNNLKRKYSFENAMLSGEMTGGVSLERLVTKISDAPDGFSEMTQPQNDSETNTEMNGSKRPGRPNLTRSTSMVTPATFGSYQVFS